jgi:hypothetical protein
MAARCAATQVLSSTPHFHLSRNFSAIADGAATCPAIFAARVPQQPLLAKLHVFNRYDAARTHHAFIAYLGMRQPLRRALRQTTG